MADFQFRADHFRAASLIVSKEETRYYLNGVHIEPDPNGGIFLVATDGHRLVVIHDPNGYAERPAILTCDFKSPALKVKRGELGRRVILAGNDATIYNCDNDAEREGVDYEPPIDRMLFQEIDGEFPTWRRVVPIDPTPNPEKTTGVFSFNPELLNQITTSARVLRDRPGANIMEMFQGSTPFDAFTIRFPSVPEAVYILMPIRGSGGPATPEWLRLTDAEEEVAA